MKNKIILACLWTSLITTANLSAQEPVILEPMFPGCGQAATTEELSCAEMKMMQFIFSNMRHPDEATKAGIKGDVDAKFTVTAAGDIKQGKIVKGLGHGCDEEVLRLIAMMPKWVAGKENGAAKDMDVEITIKFK
jgi:TonB family protein